MRRPEILAPAGDRDALAAALAAGADAVYFGLDDGFNARARATNFPSTGLLEIVALVHRAGARVYVTLNTLVFEPELPVVEELIRRVAVAGVDAIIVQDPAVALLARAICPAVDVHASTQMTASSPLAVELLKHLGLRRVVVPRELSVDEILAYQAGTDVETEVFVHGALCVAWSGQCLSSEAWGGRSANRGQCAQACRLPYTLVVDGTSRDLGDVEYLLSPKDLVGLDMIPALAAAGVRSLKIEGRLKGPAYVALAVAQYRKAVEPTFEPAVEIPMDRESLNIVYSRGDSAGFLDGADHQTLVEGRFPRHRGVALGRVIEIDGDEIEVGIDADEQPVTGGRALDTYKGVGALSRVPVPVRPGMGVVFDRGHPQDAEQGGPIFAVERTPHGHRLRFGDPGPDLAKVRVGDFVWINSDPAVTRAGAKATEAGRGALERIAVDLVVTGTAGAPLTVRASANGHEARATSASVLAPARGAGITRDLVADKLGAVGGTAFHVAAIDASGLAPGLHVPVSELKVMRRQIIAELDAAVATVTRSVAADSRIEAVRTQIAAAATSPPVIIPLCRNDAQLDAVLDAGAPEVELDWMELVGLARAVTRARARGARVTVATLRIQKPTEERIDAHLASLEPDAVLVRNWGSLAFFKALGNAAITLHGDFSLNVTNSITAGWVLDHGLATLTAAHDLDRDQLMALLAVAPHGRVAVTIHHHIPTFHTEHCVYAHLLSTGRDFRTCGRPCEHHQVALRDRIGLVHPVIVDVGCRNTVFNAQAQSAAALVPELIGLGVRRFRVELVRETAEEAHRLYAVYARLVAGTADAAEVAHVAAAQEQFGVTRGTMRTLTVLR